MTKLEQDLQLAYALIEEKEKYVEYYWQFYRLWPFTTINMKEYLNPYDLENKKCTTIQGSSDHILELFLKKPKKIIGVDTNPLTGHYGNLKLASFAVLKNPKEYLDFFRWHDYPSFCKNNYKVFDKDIFQEISKYLSGDSKSFWEELFKKYEPVKIRTNLFKDTDEENNQALYQALNYLSVENYNYIVNNREKMNFSFKNVDIRNFTESVEEEQDFITLSNLIIYAHCMYPNDTLQSYKGLIENLSQRLSKKGKIIAGYLYDIENEDDDRKIYKQVLRDKAFQEPEYSYQYVKRMRDLHCNQDSTNHDATLIYTKNNK